MSLKRQLSVTGSAPTYGDSKRRKSGRYSRASKKMTNMLFASNKALTFGEKKSFDYSSSANLVPLMSFATCTLLNPIQAGTDSFQMVGRHASIESMLLRYDVKVVPQVGASFVTLATPVTARLLVVYDKNPGGRIPYLYEIINPVTYPITDAYKGLYLANVDRFIILVDKILPMGYNSLITGGVTHNLQGGVQNEVVNIFKKMKLPFTGPSTGGVSGITEGAIFSCVYSENANNGLVYDMSARFRYVDN